MRSYTAFYIVFSVSKIFPNCVDPGKLAETMSTQVVYIRLMQETALGDQILAQHCENAREFLFPTPKLSPSYPGIDREIVLERTNHYNGLLEPKIEFSSKTTIKEVKARLKNASNDHVPVKESKRDLSPTRSRGRFEMSMTDDRITRKTAQNLSRAIASQRLNKLSKRKSFKNLILGDREVRKEKLLIHNTWIPQFHFEQNLQ